jgi:hypothetical protein
MATKEAKTLATRYLKEIAEIKKKYGETPKLSGKRYDAAVKDLAETFESLSQV